MIEKEIIINVEKYETRMALMEDAKLVELVVEQQGHEDILGNVYKGKVTNVIPAIQSVFLDIGLEKAAFLTFSDVKKKIQTIKRELEDSDEPLIINGKTVPLNPKIEDIYSVGDELLIEVIKEARGSKGPRVTDSISVSGRQLVLFGGSEFIGMSKKIKNREIRNNLKALIKDIKIPGVGFIVRTLAAETSEKDLKKEAKLLIKSWSKMQTAFDKLSVPGLVYKSEDNIFATIRDLFSSNFSKLLVDDKKLYKQIKSSLSKHTPELVEKIFLYKESIPLFDVYNIEADMEKSLRRKVWLRNGGNIVIDHAEAMTVIDINTGKNVGKRKKENSLVLEETNIAAAKEIARQIRLRDIGGIVVIDFIDMIDRGARNRVYEALKLAFINDRAPLRIASMSEFCLIELTRKRLRPEFAELYSESCPICHGAGTVFSKQTFLIRIERSLIKIKEMLGLKKAILFLHPLQITMFEEQNNKEQKDIKKITGVSLILEKDLNIDYGDFCLKDENLKHNLTEILKS